MKDSTKPMMNQLRPRRSVLYVPGSNDRALSKAGTLAADSLILDLEDSVLPLAKKKARETICDVIKQKKFGHREVMVRVNSLQTEWGVEDIMAVATSGADAIVIPKVESRETVSLTDSILNANGAAREFAIWCTLETPYGILNAQEIATSNPRVQGLIMGTTDLAKELHCAHTPMREPFFASLGHCLLAARAAGLVALDSVHLDLDDDEGYDFICRQGAEFGFDGKTVIHPKQIATANHVFSPSPELIAWSKKVIAAWDKAEREGKGVTVIDGRIIEHLHARQASRIVGLSEAILAHETESI